MDKKMWREFADRMIKARDNNQSLTFKVDVDRGSHVRFIENAYKSAIEKQKELVTPDNNMYETYKEAWDEGHPYDGAIGAQFSYEVSQTSLGPTCVIKCNITGTKENITNFDLW